MKLNHNVLYYISSKKEFLFIAISIAILSLLIFGGYKLYNHIHIEKLNRARFEHFYSRLSPYFDIYYNDAERFQRMLISEKAYPYTRTSYIHDNIPYYDAISYFCMREALDVEQEMKNIFLFFSVSMYANPLRYPPPERKDFCSAYLSFLWTGTKLTDMDVYNDDLTLKQFKDSVNDLMREIRKCYVIISNPCSKNLPLIDLFNPNSFSNRELKLDYYENMIE